MPLKENLIFGTKKEACGLGDTLLLTSVCKNLNFNPTIQLRPSEKRFGLLFDKLAKFEITYEVNEIQDIGDDHFILSKLRNFYEHPEFFDLRPIVLHCCDESEKWAYEYLLGQNKPSVVYQPQCSKKWHYMRSLPISLQKELLYNYKNKYNIIDMSSEKFKNLELSKYIALLRKCGRYVGCNTGDMHLAISVGCLCEVWEPTSSKLFRSDNWRYDHQTIKYFNF